MKHFKLLLFLFFIGAALHAQTQDHFQDRLILKVKPQYLSLCHDDSIGIPELYDIIGDDGFALKRKFPNAKPPAPRNAAGVELRTVYEITFQNTPDLNKLTKALNGSDRIQYAEKKYIDQTTFTPNDPRYTDGNQPYLNTVDAEAAWSIQQGSSDIVIGVVDVGSQLDHPDLENKMAVNEDDPINGSDSDGNGFRDDYYGWDFYNDDHLPEPDGNENHGSHVAGLAAAHTDNNIGIASLGFNTRFIPIKAGQGNRVTHGYEGVVYAADRGAQIINCSWGGFNFSEFARDVVNYAFVNHDALVIGASGNNGEEVEFYPAAYEPVMAVGSCNNDGEPSSFSNYGYYVDIAAPGESLLSTVPGSGYNNNSGTSMAAPVAAAAAALLMAEFPNISPGQVIARLKATAFEFQNFNSSSARYRKSGTGYINPAAALQGSLNEPWFELAHMFVSDSADEFFTAGDTLRIAASFINYLDTSDDVEVVMVSGSGLTALTDTAQYGIFATSEQKDNRSDPFEFVIDQNTQRDQVVEPEFQLTAGQHVQTFYREIRVNPTFIDVTVNRTATTATSLGRVGYNKRETDQGLGFRLQDRNSMLYEAGIMIGGITHEGDTVVVDVVRNDPENDDRDLEPVDFIERDFSADEAFFAQASFSDTAESDARRDSLGLYVSQTVTAYNDFGHDQYVIFEFEVSNISPRTFTHVHIGMLADWDIANYSRNRTFEMKNRRTAAAKDLNNELFGAVQLLQGYNFNSYAIDNENGGRGGIEILDGFDTHKKYFALSNSRPEAGTGSSGSDVLQIISAGPYVLSSGSTHKIAFAFFAGESEEDLERLADSAAKRYTGSPFVGIDNLIRDESEPDVWPNPFGDQLQTRFVDGHIKEVFLYDSGGRLIRNNRSSGETVRISTSSLQSGLYILHVKTDNGEFRRKVIKR